MVENIFNILTYFQGFIYAEVVRYIRFNLKLKQDADTPDVRRNTLSRLHIPRIKRTSCMEFICYGQEIINYIIVSFKLPLEITTFNDRTILGS